MEELYKKFRKSAGAVTDTRKNLLDKMFFALKGPNFDGNQYAEQALDGGAMYAVVDDISFSNHEKIILVENVLKVLQDLASMHKTEIDVPVIGITGTNGKTTNKELLSLILSKSFNCYSTKGNLNNHIGVPLSLLEILPSHNMAIIEMGANKMGDIKELCAIADPDFAYITNIGIAHLEGFGSKDNIKIEKGELFRYVEEKKSPFFVNTAEAEVVEISDAYEKNIYVGESENDNYTFQPIDFIPQVKLNYGDRQLNSLLYGRHNYENIKMAAGIALYFDVPLDLISEALREYQPDNNRSQVVEKDGYVIFMDAYNANPSSMKSSILSFANFEASEKCLILGDMLEMGESSDKEHEKVLRIVREFDWKQVILIGNCFSQFKDQFQDYNFFESTAKADVFLAASIPIASHILLKGSRGQALEKLQFIQKLQ